ncbi:MAG: glycosyltransferase family 4 protein [Acidiferrobacterales bacterium]
MKILFHHRIRSKDGQYVHMEELIGALKALGMAVAVVGPPAVQKDAFGAESRFLVLLKRYLPGVIYESLELFYNVLDYRRLRKAADEFKPDCLYERYNLYLLSGVWLKREYRLPMLLEVNAPIYEERKKYGGIAIARLARWSERTTWHAADYVLPVSRVLAEQIKQAGVRETRIALIPNAIDPQRFNMTPRTEDAKAALGLQDKLVLGFVGFMREWHRLERVLELLSDNEHNDRHLHLVGDGPARDNLEQRAAALGISDKLTITGTVNRDDLARHIAAFDIALQPDVVEYASPLKLFEYMAVGRAIVAPATPNIKEILSDGKDAILFDPKESGAFLQAVERLAGDPALRDKIGRGARETVIKRGLTWENNALKVSNLFSQLLGKTAG